MALYLAWIGGPLLAGSCSTSAPPPPAPGQARFSPRPSPVWTPQEASLAHSAGPLTAGDAIDLDRALALALANRPELTTGRHLEEALRADAAVAALRPDPRLGFEVEDFAGTDGFSDLNSAQTTLSLSQTFERGGKRSARNRQSQANVGVSRLNQELQRKELVAEVKRAFYAALAARAELDLAQSALDRSQSTLAAMESRSSEGRGAPVELSRYTLAYRTAELDQITSQRRWKAALRRLAQTWGADPTNPGALPGDLSGDYPGVDAPPPLETFLSSFAASLRVRRQELEREQAAAAVASAQAASSANINVSLGLRRFESTDDYAATIGLGMPLRRSQRSSELERAAKARHAQTIQQQAAQRLVWRSQIAAAWESMTASYTELRALQGGMLQDADSILGSTTEGYRIGRFALIDVLDAQRTSFAMQARQARARSDYHQAKAEMERVLALPNPEEIANEQ